MSLPLPRAPLLHRRVMLALPLALAGAALPAYADVVDWGKTPLRLLMVDKPGCVYCAAWDRQIAPGYAASPEGRQAPLLRVDMGGPWPDGLALASHPFVTPTFVLLREGMEVGRIEGYPGADGFYPRLAALLAAV